MPVFDHRCVAIEKQEEFSPGGSLTEVTGCLPGRVLKHAPKFALDLNKRKRMLGLVRMMMHEAGVLPKQLEHPGLETSAPT